MTEKNIEIESAKQAIKLLKQYVSANTAAQKAEILDRLHDENLTVYLLITKSGYEPEILISKMEKALDLDKYRPKNLSIPLLAISPDLDFIGGEFDTFDYGLHKMFKDKESPENIRQKFRAATVNVYLLAEQFTADWIRRLKKHSDLVIAARDANDKNAIDAYNKLFEALTDDFSKEYDNIKIHSQGVPDWEHSDIQPKPELWDSISGMHSFVTALVLDTDMPEVEQQRLKEDYEKNPENHKWSLVRINITNARKLNKVPKDFFIEMIGLFVHEIHHVLDAQRPRMGALGPQVAEIDRNIYVSPAKGEKEYRDSATEISSYAIQNRLQTELYKTYL